MDDKKNTELLKKLRILAERGERGERDAARKKLEQLMQKYEISEADLRDDVIEEHEFHYKDQYQRSILNQVFYKVNHERKVLRYNSGKGRDSILVFRSTKAEAAQARVEYDFYCDLWEEEVDLFLSSFIQKHRIFRSDPEAPKEQVDKETEKRMLDLMKGMQDKSMVERLEDGK